jgi:hypothetical protein
MAIVPEILSLDILPSKKAERQTRDLQPTADGGFSLSTAKLWGTQGVL